MRPWYATRERVKSAPDIRLTARDNDQVDQAIDASTRSVEKVELKSTFYPLIATYTFRRPRCRTLMLDDAVGGAGLVELDTLTVDGTAVDPDDRDLLPVDGPPFLRIEFAWSVVFGLDRRPISIDGIWGYDNLTVPAGTLSAAMADASTTTADVTDSNVIGVGSLLTIDTEKLLVAEKTMLDTGQDLQAPDLTASKANETVNVTTGNQFAVGEVIQLDAERMRIVSITGNALTVKRAWDGTTLATHTSGVSIFAPRRLTVERGVLGTTATSHTASTSIAEQLYPAPVTALTTALAVVQLLNETGGYTQDTGSDRDPMANAGRALRDARRRATGLARLPIA